MARKLDLDSLQPDDIALGFRGKEYLMPGAIPVPTIMRFLRLQHRVEETKGKSDKEVGEVLEGILREVTESGDPNTPGIMELLRERQPDLETLPFSMDDVLEIITFLIADQNVETVRKAGEPEQPEEEQPPLAQAS